MRNKSHGIVLPSLVFSLLQRYSYSELWLGLIVCRCCVTSVYEDRGVLRLLKHPVDPTGECGDSSEHLR